MNGFGDSVKGLAKRIDCNDANPIFSTVGKAFGQLDPSELRIVKLRRVKPDGGLLHIDRIELGERCVEDQVTVGSTQFVEYEELAVSGDAEVLSIQSAAEIGLLDGRRAEVMGFARGLARSIGGADSGFLPCAGACAGRFESIRMISRGAICGSAIR
jgi:hypothetical protein